MERIDSRVRPGSLVFMRRLLLAAALILLGLGTFWLVFAGPYAVVMLVLAIGATALATALFAT